MGKAISSLARRSGQNWNAENRAQKFLSEQERPAMSPRHSTTKYKVDEFVKDNPEITEKVQTKDESLANMLRGMTVEPERMGEIVNKAKRDKTRMPEDRARPIDMEFGYLEPEVIRPGRCTIRQALDFLTDHANDPAKTGNAEAIARKYKLDNHRVQNVLRYFYVFNIHLPKKLADSLPKSAERDKMLQRGVFQQPERLESGEKRH